MTKNHINGGITVSELCAAALTLSDNSAANLLIKKLGGLTAINAFARSIGDKQFELDRLEPQLNSAIPGDIRDTTTPEAMANSLKRLTLGDILAFPQRIQLQTWLKNNTTGNAKIRAGVPKDWIVGDKTGSGGYGTTNDIGIIWPPKRAPIVVAIFFTKNKKGAVSPDSIIERITRILMSAIVSTNRVTS
ncbi:hypothetical protein CbuD7D7780_04280 [Coxiella burnetii]|nr:hypothetical protein CbuD7E6568_04260 [Coxiella burnetii]OYK82449.1 hypothetical protein CbuD7D7780_04280 [Coxiella burnetii]